ncbi:hypothetical protein NUW58_g5722 [Xylaria curta]|uniref:Uncharacterized protein n=1 Tax=Xylaria curta TaxID=42375 RepID=A0ACC1P0E5_9PEZI|nr:hypothetical protein NUW58_g5722 [Xylaria curta]
MMPKPAGTNRQPGGFACEECRRRKTRCNRQQPRCSSCQENNSECITMYQRPQRGPKKGQLERMRLRIGECHIVLPHAKWHRALVVLLALDAAALEWELGKKGVEVESDVPAVSVSPPAVDETIRERLVVPTPLTLPAMAAEPPVPAVCSPLGSSVTGFSLEQYSYADIGTAPNTLVAQVVEPTRAYLDWSGMTTHTHLDVAVDPEVEGLDRDTCPPQSARTTAESHHNNENASMTSLCNSVEISDLMRADLDEVYFERPHEAFPMLHQQRYFSWAGRDNISHAQMCLRSAVHTLAAAMSAPYRHLGNQLYTQTRCLLEESAQKLSRDRGNVNIGYIQAWLLLAHYESLRVDELQAMLTSGRAFRLVQMARLHDTDVPDTSGGVFATAEDSYHNSRFVIAEERRRTFWIAYTLDYFLSWREEQPLTLSTRLPAPELNFQNAQPFSNVSLSEAVSKEASIATALSPFARCVLLVTLHGRCRAHRRTSCKGGGRDETGGFWPRHEWLASMIERQVTALTKTPSTLVAERNSMLFFTRLLAYSAIIHLGDTVLWLPWQATERERSAMSLVHESTQRASRATLEIAHIVKESLSLSYFKAHPFLPILLGSALAYLNTQNDGRHGAEDLLGLLRGLREVNELALGILSVFDGV